MRLIDIDAGFGISESSGAAKLAAIRKMLKIHQLDHEWTLPSRMVDNPLEWMLQVNGLMMDVRHAPREVQEMAFKKGLIPHIPADQADELGSRLKITYPELGEITRLHLGRTASRWSLSKIGRMAVRVSVTPRS